MFSVTHLKQNHISEYFVLFKVFHVWFAHFQTFPSFLPFFFFFLLSDTISAELIWFLKLFGSRKKLPKIFWPLKSQCCWNPYLVFMDFLEAWTIQPMVWKVLCKCTRSQLSSWSWWPDHLNSLCFTWFWYNVNNKEEFMFSILWLFGQGPSYCSR